MKALTVVVALAGPAFIGCGDPAPASESHVPRPDGSETPIASTAEPAAPPPSCSPLEPIPPRLWRLSPAQFSNSVRDLLGLDRGPEVSDTGGASEYAFFSDASSGVNGAFAFSLYEAVRAAIEAVRPRIGELAACTAAQSQDECARAFAERFGSMAFRRPLARAEVDALLAVYDEGSQQDFDTGIADVVEALLQSPSFLYRSELGMPDGSGPSALDDHEVATQLSYLFLDSTPDAELSDAAERGELVTESGLAAQVDRLLAMPEVQKNLNRIVIDWFGARQVLGKTTKSAALLSSLPEAERDPVALSRELFTSVELFLDDLLWRRARPLNDLVRSPRVFVNRRLATLYGLPFSGSSSDFVGVDFPEAEERAGIMTQPAVLWAVSDPEATSIVHRGLYVHKDILCLEPVPSPGDLLQQPDIREKLATLTTEREKSEYRMGDPTCRTCHSQIDPFGLVLEAFDPVGAHRTSDEDGPIDPTGEFTFSPSLMGEITGARTFAEGAARDELFASCATMKLASYAIGRSIGKRDTCEVDAVLDRYATSDGTIRSLFREVALAAFLRTRGAALE